MSHGNSREMRDTVQGIRFVDRKPLLTYVGSGGRVGSANGKWMSHQQPSMVVEEPRHNSRSGILGREPPSIYPSTSSAHSGNHRNLFEIRPGLGTRLNKSTGEPGSSFRNRLQNFINTERVSQKWLLRRLPAAFAAVSTSTGQTLGNGRCAG